jgi:alkanesulfonate monooxygenase SsuD/methylene tetrahydromethanopterin reductase-like flavin-dependent oxidoreductase (luciferase family)
MTRPPGTGVPFAPGSVSLRLYPHNDLEASDIVGEFCHQARLALDGGFDGVMTSEHHGGFAGYLPNPLQMAGFVLEETSAGWAAACPVILPLRPVAQLAEETAWLAARHPGRVGLGVAAGALPLDFEVMGVPASDAVPLFKERLPRIVSLLQGRSLGPLGGDAALQACSSAPIPVLSAAVSTAAARRAASVGAGVLTDGMSSAAAVRKLCDAYAASGGTQSRVLIRRVWLGAARTELIEHQQAVYRSYAPARADDDDQTVIADRPEELAARLHEVMDECGADALNLRVHLPGIEPTEAREQIEALAADVVPLVRELLVG